MRHICVFHISNLPARHQRSAARANSFPGGHGGREPPDPIPNSEVKTLCADGSVAVGHVRVGHCQDPIEAPDGNVGGFFFVQTISASPVTLPFPVASWSGLHLT